MVNNGFMKSKNCSAVFRQFRRNREQICCEIACFLMEETEI